jgi:hypothetical protein
MRERSTEEALCGEARESTPQGADRPGLNALCEKYVKAQRAQDVGQIDPTLLANSPDAPHPSGDISLFVVLAYNKPITMGV